jgi:hypothetical protein
MTWSPFIPIKTIPNHSWDVSRAFVMIEKQWFGCYVSWSDELRPAKMALISNHCFLLTFHKSGCKILPKTNPNTILKPASVISWDLLRKNLFKFLNKIGKYR